VLGRCDGAAAEIDEIGLRPLSPPSTAPSRTWPRCGGDRGLPRSSPRPGGCRPAGRARRRTGGRSWLSTWASDRPPAARRIRRPRSRVHVPLPAPLLAALAMATRCWSPRAPGRMGTVRMSFASRRRVVYLLTKPSPARPRWARDPWCASRAGLPARRRGVVQRVMADELDPLRRRPSSPASPTRARRRGGAARAARDRHPSPLPGGGRHD